MQYTLCTPLMQTTSNMCGQKHYGNAFIYLYISGVVECFSYSLLPLQKERANK